MRLIVKLYDKMRSIGCHTGGVTGNISNRGTRGHGRSFFGVSPIDLQHAPSHTQYRLSTSASGKCVNR